MLNFNYSLFEETLRISSPTILVVEDTLAFSAIVRAFYRYDEAKNLKIFNDQYVRVKESELVVITDIMSYEFNSPVILKQIYSDIEAQLNEQPALKSEIDRLSLAITTIFEDELIEHELMLTLSDLSISDLLKVAKIQVVVHENTMLEKMMQLIRIFMYSNKKKVLVLINTCSYIAVEELDALCEYIALCQVNVLILEPRKTARHGQYILDKDFYLHLDTML